MCGLPQRGNWTARTVWRDPDATAAQMVEVACTSPCRPVMSLHTECWQTSRQQQLDVTRSRSLPTTEGTPPHARTPVGHRPVFATGVAAAVAVLRRRGAGPGPAQLLVAAHALAAKLHRASVDCVFGMQMHAADACGAAAAMSFAGLHALQRSFYTFCVSVQDDRSCLGWLCRLECWLAAPVSAQSHCASPAPC